MFTWENKIAPGNGGGGRLGGASAPCLLFPKALYLHISGNSFLSFTKLS